jgi:hypothetical protein
MSTAMLVKYLFESFWCWGRANGIICIFIHPRELDDFNHTYITIVHTKEIKKQSNQNNFLSLPCEAMKEACIYQSIITQLTIYIAHKDFFHPLEIYASILNQRSCLSCKLDCPWFPHLSRYGRFGFSSATSSIRGSSTHLSHPCLETHIDNSGLISLPQNSNLPFFQPISSIYSGRGGSYACVACDLDFDSCSERRGEERREGTLSTQSSACWLHRRFGHRHQVILPTSFLGSERRYARSSHALSFSLSGCVLIAADWISTFWFIHQVTWTHAWGCPVGSVRSPS